LRGSKKSREEQRSAKREDKQNRELTIEKDWLGITCAIWFTAMGFLDRFKPGRRDDKLPLHLRHGAAGERAARAHLKKNGLKYLTANFRTDRGEIDLVFRDGDCLVFVEVKTRSSEAWLRPAAAVNARKRLRLTRCAFDYLRLLRNPPIKIRFDIVEVLLEDGTVSEMRHLPNTFTLTPPFRYG
jgi:putative endonuclease